MKEIFQLSKSMAASKLYTISPSFPDSKNWMVSVQLNFYRFTRIVILCLIFPSSLFGKCTLAGPKKINAAPALGQTSYELRSSTVSGIQIEYSSPLGIRIEHENGDITIWNFTSGENHFLSHSAHKDFVHRGEPLIGKIRYYGGGRNLYKVDICSFIGEKGTLWRSPAVGFALEQDACITPDGIILETANDGRPATTPLTLWRRSIPLNFYDVPSGYIRVVTQ